MSTAPVPTSNTPTSTLLERAAAVPTKKQHRTGRKAGELIDLALAVANNEINTTQAKTALGVGNLSNITSILGAVLLRAARNGLVEIKHDDGEAGGCFPLRCPVQGRPRMTQDKYFDIALNALQACRRGVYVHGGGLSRPTVSPA